MVVETFLSRAFYFVCFAKLVDRYYQSHGQKDVLCVSSGFPEENDEVIPTVSSIQKYNAEDETLTDIYTVVIFIFITNETANSKS